MSQSRKQPPPGKHPIKLDEASIDADSRYRGKFHKTGNKDAEISASEINSIVIPPGSSSDVSSCGRSDSPSGTEGTIDLYDGSTKICTVYWNCPWGSKSNDFQIRDRNSSAGYMVSVGDWNRDSGALGTVEIEVGRRG